ncbi:peptidase [Microvirga tunisiensis]|uniref:Peptidase n=2 Tax=Pannonibacter tanglangensis TaxID=2750084 RepID=A0A7X5F507_9HYPH|nr:peptidase [Pannonibacter sp. XCT-34]NBN78609.1 peptidase [Pannonibacter sp. XCT-53]
MTDSHSPQPPVPVFDGHNDTLLKLEMRAQDGRARSFFDEAREDHIDLPRARRGGFAGGLFAMFVPSVRDQAQVRALSNSDPRHFGRVGQAEALDCTLRMMARAFRLERERPDQVRVARSHADILAAMEAGQLAMVLHIEGAEAIDPDFAALDVLYQAGLRSIGPVWSRQNIFSDGVPMAFPSSPDTGAGLTDLGRELVRRCNRLGVMLDLSHITEKGFWDVAGLSERPLIASHSNAHALCPSARNLTDRQLDAIAESRGLVGINFHVAFLRDDGRHNPDTPLETIVRHADHLISRLGEDHVGLGSDFDGCVVPRAIGDVAGLPALLEAFRKAGYGEELIAKIAWRNWLSVIARSGL